MLVWLKKKMLLYLPPSVQDVDVVSVHDLEIQR